jgi:hypothetical protein
MAATPPQRRNAQHAGHAQQASRRRSVSRACGATNKAPGGETGVEQANTPLARPPQSSPRDSACWTCSGAPGAVATTAGTAGTVVIDAVRGDPPGDRRLTPVTTDYAVPSSLQGRASGSGGFAVLIPSFSCAMRVSTPHHPAGARAQASEAGEKRPVSDGAPRFPLLVEPPRRNRTGDRILTHESRSHRYATLRFRSSFASVDRQVYVLFVPALRPYAVGPKCSPGSEHISPASACAAAVAQRLGRHRGPGAR